MKFIIVVCFLITAIVAADFDMATYCNCTVHGPDYCFETVCSGSMNQESSCFSLDTRIATPNGAIPLGALSVGDNVFAYRDGNYIYMDTIIAFIHISFTENVTMVKVMFDDGSVITGSHDHIIFLSIYDTVHLGDLHNGDMVWSVNGFINVTSIEETIVNGYSAPLTTTGTYLLSDAWIMVSNYAKIRNHYLAHAWMSPMRWYHTYISYGSTSEGIHPYAKYSMELF